jgi:hydrogenase nickel incorporation protein HypB
MMCVTCGCSADDGAAILTNLQTGERFLMHDDHDHPLDGHSHDHSHNHDHKHGHGPHDHSHDHAHGHDHSHSHHGHSHDHDHGHNTLHLQEEILAKNNLFAERNRGWFDGRNVLALNLMSSPGSGKTTLLEHTIRDLGSEIAFSVIEGDQATANDAERIRATGCKVVQINTGTGCHLDAAMVGRGVKQLDPSLGSVVLIENVGNLVCPALFDLGERAKVVVVSVTEGEDKPVKYPHMFRASELMLVNKIDLLPYVNFNVERCVEYAKQVNPRLRVLLISATRGDGLPEWYEWIRSRRG